DAVGNQDDGQDVLPAHLLPPASAAQSGVVLYGPGRHHMISSSLRVCRKPSHEMNPTITKIRIDMAEARPKSRVPASKAIEKTIEIRMSVWPTTMGRPGKFGPPPVSM